METNTATNVISLHNEGEGVQIALVSPDVGKLLNDKDLVIRATANLPERISEADAGKLYSVVYSAVTERDARPEAVATRAVKAAKRDVKTIDAAAYDALMMGDSIASEIARKAHAIREARKAERKASRKK